MAGTRTRAYSHAQSLVHYPKHCSSSSPLDSLPLCHLMACLRAHAWVLTEDRVRASLSVRACAFVWEVDAVRDYIRYPVRLCLRLPVLLLEPARLRSACSAVSAQCIQLLCIKSAGSEVSAQHTRHPRTPLIRLDHRAHIAALTCRLHPRIRSLSVPCHMLRTPLAVA